MTLPRYTAQNALEDVPYLINGLHSVGSEDVLMASGQVSSLTPTTRHPPGTVLAYYTAGAEYVLATDSNADTGDAASVRSLITNPGAGGWDGNLLISGHWGSLTVALSADDTDAAVAAAIIAAAAAVNPEGPQITAADEVADSVVSITNKDVGADTWLKVTHATVATAFGANGATDAGTDPEIRVTTHYAELADIDGTAKDDMVPCLYAGYFDESNLVALTAQAKAVLTRRGSRFG